MNIGTTIRNVAREKGISAADIHRATGLSEGYLSMLLNAKIEDPQLSKVWKIACVLGVTVDYLINESIGQ